MGDDDFSSPATDASATNFLFFPPSNSTQRNLSFVSDYHHYGSPTSLLNRTGFSSLGTSFARTPPMPMLLSTSSSGGNNRAHQQQKTTQISIQQLIIAVCKSLLPNEMTSLPVPLSLDYHNSLIIDFDRWAIDSICSQDSWQCSQLEAILKNASEIRRKFCLISKFIASPPTATRDFESKYLLSHSDLVSSVFAALKTFDALKAEVMERINSGNSLSNLSDLGAFLLSLKERLATLPSFFEQLLIASTDARIPCKSQPILTFWTNFIKSLNFWPVYEADNQIPLWKSLLFESLIHMLGRYLSLRLQRCQPQKQPTLGGQTSSNDEAGRWDLMESFWAEDMALLDCLNFASTCERMAPLRELEERNELCPFHETFVKQWGQLKAEGRLRYTQNFFSFLARHALNEHCDRLDRTVLAQLSVGNLLGDQLILIMNTYSMYSCWTLNETQNENRCGTRIFIEQPWPLRILLDDELYRRLNAVAVHLGRLQYAFQLVTSALTMQERPRRRWTSGAVPFVTDTVKERIRRTLNIQLARQLQALLQILLIHFNSMNFAYIGRMTNLVQQTEVNNEHKIKLKNPLDMVRLWKDSLSTLLYFFDDLLREPIEEIVQIGAKFCEYPSRKGTTTDDDDHDVEMEDVEVRDFGDWLERLRRACLFIRHRELLCEFTSSATEQMGPNASGSPRQQKLASPIDLLNALKLMTLPYN